MGAREAGICAWVDATTLPTVTGLPRGYGDAVASGLTLSMPLEEDAYRAAVEATVGANIKAAKG